MRPISDRACSLDISPAATAAATTNLFVSPSVLRGSANHRDSPQAAATAAAEALQNGFRAAAAAASLAAKSLVGNHPHPQTTTATTTTTHHRMVPDNRSSSVTSSGSKPNHPTNQKCSCLGKNRVCTVCTTRKSQKVGSRPSWTLFMFFVRMSQSWHPGV